MGVLTATEEDLVDVLFPVEHLIGLVDDHVLEATKSQNARAVDEINQTAGGSNEDIATLAEEPDLISDGSATVDDAWTQHGTIAKLAGLVEDLDSKFTGGNDDKHERLSGDFVSALHERGGVGAEGCKFLGFAHELGDDRDHIGCSLAGAWDC